MKTTFCLFLSVLSVMVCTRPSFAGTGLELREECRTAQQDESLMTSEQHLNFAQCVSYVLGVAEGFYLGGGHSCVPNGVGVTSKQLGMVVSKYLEDHPEELNVQSGVLVIRALRKAFPCK